MNRRVLVAYANTDQTFEKLRRQQAALAKFGRFAFNETDLLTMDAAISSVGFDRRLQGCCIAASHTFITICQASDGQR
jgi:hypothetical protein